MVGAIDISKLTTSYLLYAHGQYSTVEGFHKQIPFKGIPQQYKPDYANLPKLRTPSASNDDRFHMACHGRRSSFTVTEQHQLAAIMRPQRATIRGIPRTFIASSIGSTSKISSSCSSSELLCRVGLVTFTVEAGSA
jgi:hypothetical protein